MKFLRPTFLVLGSLILISVVQPVQAAHLALDVTNAIARFKKRDPGIKSFFDKSVAYAVFPNVGKGGFIIGAANGDGLVYEKGKLIGESTLTQATIGLQAGGQEFSEILFFETEEALNAFKKSKFSMAADVSAVIAADGAAGKARYTDGIAVFLLPKGGLMLEAAVGGQKFSFDAKGK